MAYHVTAVPKFTLTRIYPNSLYASVLWRTALYMLSSAYLKKQRGRKIQEPMFVTLYCCCNWCFGGFNTFFTKQWSRNEWHILKSVVKQYFISKSLSHLKCSSISCGQNVDLIAAVLFCFCWSVLVSAWNRMNKYVLSRCLKQCVMLVGSGIRIQCS